jgi:hypothetical protein
MVIHIVNSTVVFYVMKLCSLTSITLHGVITQEITISVFTTIKPNLKLQYLYFKCLNLNKYGRSLADILL